MATRIRRTARQAAATARLVALNAARRSTALARRGGAAIATAARTAAPVAKRAGRRVAQTGFSVAKSITVGQSRVAPGLAGGYAHAWLEEKQREAHAKAIQSGKESGAVIKDPIYRLAAEAAAVAVGMTMTSNPMLREAMAGAAGSIGAHYKLYTSKSGMNPVDDYAAQVKAGKDGVST